jgi:aspartate racemase
MKSGLFLLIILLIFGAAITTSGCTAAAPSVPTKVIQNQSLVQNPASMPNGTQTKTIGIIGGMSWLSTAEYYRIINEETRNKLGGLHSAKILMYSEDFADIERLQTEGNWPELTQRMITDAQRLEAGGADAIIIATNTMHKTADDVSANIHIPVINIIETTGDKVKAKGYTRVILLGTKYTMEQDFYKGRLEKEYNLTVIIPNQTERDYIHSVIFNELCQGQIKNESREEFKRIINRLAIEGNAQGVILGCTEIPLLIKQKDVNITVFDTTIIHAKAAAAFALNKT